MKYMGSKNRHAKELLPIILKHRKPGQYYVEPFCGGCNMIDKVTGPRIANDSHTALIAMFDALINSRFQIPNEVSEEEYKKARSLPDTCPLKGFIGFGCSYSGRYFEGYARGNTPGGVPRNYCLESKNNILKQIEGLKGVKFISGSYEDLVLTEPCIIYCDPPYENTKSYKDKFKHAAFWGWCRFMLILGHTIYVSEYSAPDDFVCVWEREVNSSLTKNTGAKQSTEKLFVHKSQLYLVA